MAGDERDIDVAGFADGLAVVESFEDGEAAGMFLDLASEGVEIAGAGVRRKRLPGGESRAGGFDSGVDVCGGALGDVGEFFGGGGIGGVEEFIFEGRLPRAVNEMAEAAVVMVEPGERFAGIFGGRAVVHGDEFFDDAHSVLLDSYVRALDALKIRAILPLRDGVT